MKKGTSGQDIKIDSLKKFSTIIRNIRNLCFVLVMLPHLETETVRNPKT